MTEKKNILFGKFASSLGVFYVTDLYIGEHDRHVDDNGKNPKKPQRIIRVEKCNFKCSNKKDYNRHLSDPQNTNIERIQHEMTTKNPKSSSIYECECGKIYKYTSIAYQTINRNAITTEDINNADEDRQLEPVIA